MRFVIFRTPKPKQFTYRPRYYDEDKERLEQRKAELGYDSTVSHSESVRLRMHRRWKHHDEEVKRNNISRFIYFAFYAFVIIGSVYMIFFTDFVDKLIALFGVGNH